MSSVQSFLRQRVTGSTLLPGPSPVQGSLTYFVLQADASNYVGNYPPGVMIDATAQVNGLLATNSITAGATAPVLRDMGKTIKATFGLTGTQGFFRAVQIINPSTVASATSQSNYGVIGSPAGFLPAGNAGDDGFGTYYIPIVVGGVIASGVALSPAGIKLGEQL